MTVESGDIVPVGNSAKAPPRVRGRALWTSVHKWLGLALGLIVAIIGVTGSILVFYQELDEWLNPALYYVSPPHEGATYRSLDEIYAAAGAAAPKGAVAGFTAYPRHADVAFEIDFTRPREGSLVSDFWQVFVDPYTAKVIGRRDVRTGDQWIARAFIPFVFDLHLSLLMPFKQGQVVVGIIAVLAVASILSGLYLWWPSKGKWKRALGLRLRAGGKRLVFDLHQVFGIYPWIVLLAVLVSGIYFNLPAQFLSVVRIFSPETIDRQGFVSTPTANGSVTSIADALLIANDISPDGRVVWVSPASSPTAPHWLCKNGVYSVSRIFDLRCFYIDQYSGKVLFTEDVVTGTRGNSFLAWQWPFHSGQAFGMPGRILVLLSGLACLGLFVTGVMRWLDKRGARRTMAARRQST